jgi:hypothetical protein
MPNIPFPNVPPYPGVPALVRGANIPPVIQVALGQVQTLLAAAVQSGTLWGIFDPQGNQLGMLSQGNGLFQSIIQQIAGGAGPILSTSSLEFDKETIISDFPLEADNSGNNAASFASYNKVERPANPKVVLSLGGSESDRTAFLNLINAACTDTELYSVVTPEVVYYNYSVERYSYRRTATQGATMLMVEISLKEIRQVSAQFSTVQTPINQPQNPDATPQTNSGSVQPQSPPPQSTLKAIYNSFPSLQSLVGGGG